MSLWDRIGKDDTGRGGGGSMRGTGDPQEVMLAMVNLEERVPKDHPLRNHQGGSRRGVGTSLT